MTSINFKIFILVSSVFVAFAKFNNSQKFRFPLLARYLVNKCDLKFHYEKNTLNVNQFKVGVVGAGISGLYTALILQDLNIDYEIFEATNRIGGRLYTHHFDQNKAYNYVEMGGMRFPAVPQYDRLIGRQHWSLISYLNRNLPANSKVKLIPFLMKNKNDIIYFNHKHKRRDEFEASGDIFGFGKRSGGFIDDKYADKNVFFWESNAFDYIRRQINSTFDKGLDYLKRNDYKTFRGFLSEPNNKELSYPSDVVDWIETFDAETGRFSYSLLDIYLADDLFSNQFFTIKGGVSKLIESMVSLLRKKPKISRPVTAVTQSLNKKIILTTNNGKFEFTHVILTPTFAALRDIDFNCDLHLKKRIAMRTLPYQFSIKIGFEFRTRFWENPKMMKGKPITGGNTITDLPIRQIVYPSYGINCSSCNGALLVSYAWTRDAKKFLGLNDDEIIMRSLKDLAEIHGSVIYEQFTGKYVVIDWSLNKFTQGAYSAFDPGNFMSYYPYIIYPESKGRLHFAGDTLSIYHGWSIGALTSAYRAVKDLLLYHGLNGKIEEMKQKWGTIEEPDFSNFSDS